MHPLSSEEKKVRIVQFGNFVKKVGSNLRQKNPCNYKANIAVLLSAALLFPPQFLLPMCCPHPIFWPYLMYVCRHIFIPFVSLFPFFVQEADLGLDDLTITSQRSQVVDFSAPYETSTLEIMLQVCIFTLSSTYYFS